jgi:hypothetical protein
MTDAKDEIAALRKRVEELEAKGKPAPEIDWEKRIAEHMNEVHQMREGRMALASNFHADDLRAMEAAAPTLIVKGIALRDARAPTGPSSAGTSGQVSRVSSNPGLPGSNTSGWVDPRPLGPPPGIHHVDAQMIADEVRQRAELKRKLGEK